MRHLLAKDLRLVAPYLWGVVPLHALWCTQSLVSPELYFWTSLVGALAWTVAVIMIEWHFDTDRFVASLPVSREAIVNARYASACCGLAVGATLFVAYGRVAMSLAPEHLIRRLPAAPAWASADGVLAFLGLGFLLLIGFLPFFFRLGFPLGGGLFGAAAVVAAGAFTAAMRFTPSLGASDAVRGWLLSLARAWGVVPALAAVLAAAAALSFVSVRLSVRFYETREL
jgi:hypothetical protein